MVDILEKIDWEKFVLLPVGSVIRSIHGDMVVINQGLYAEILSLANFRGKEGESRYVCITYNEERLRKLFGSNVHDYVNFIMPGDTAGRHYHKNTREIFYNLSLECTISVKLKNLETGEEIVIELNGQLVEFEGHKWLREIIIPEGLAHSVHNPNESMATIAVVATFEHGTEDMFSCEM